MFKNHLKIAFRGFFRNTMFTGFNLVSLLVGLLVSYLAIGYIVFENSYDTFHEDSENIYRLTRTYRSQDYSVIDFGPLGENEEAAQVAKIKGLKTIPGIDNAAQFITSNNSEFIDWKGKRVQEKAFLTTNTPKEFVTLFTWNPIAGSLEDFGSDVNKVMLTRSAAERIFGNTFQNPDAVIGEAVNIGDETMKVAVVIEDVPLNSHFDFKMALNKPRINYWGSRIYLSLEEQVTYEKVQNSLNAEIGAIYPNVIGDINYKQHFLQPIEDIHLHSNILYELKTPGNLSFILLIGFFALFILIITLFNYANFTLAVKSKQGKSIGIKKAVGAKNSSIASQFLIEGILLALLSLPILAALAALVVPYFNDLMMVSLKVYLWEDITAMLSLIGLAFLLGLLASITPAFYLSGKNALQLFKENLKDNRFQHFSIRKYLIVSQFVLLITISCVSYFVLQQINFIDNKDVGYKKEGVLYAYTSPENQDFFQGQLHAIPEIKNVGNGSSLGIETYNQGTYRLQGIDEVFDDSNQLYLDPEALDAYGIEMKIGSVPKDGRTTIINRTAAEKFAKVKNVSFGDLIGTTVITEPEYVDADGNVGFPFVIGGIFEDINVFSLREKIAPYFITVSPNVRMDGLTIVSYDSDDTKVVADKIRQVYRSMDESYPLELEFLSQNMADLYQQDRQTAQLISWMNLIAIGLSGLGIIGITLFLVIARTKEIGIRRVLGASEIHIIKSTVKEYVYFIAIALVIGWPIAYYTSDRWLSNFAYRIDIQQLVFIGVGLLTFLFTALLVGAVAFRAARLNPARSLRSS